MIADEDDDRGLLETEFPECVEQQADLVVDQRDGGVVGRDRLPLLVVGVEGVIRVPDERRNRNVVAVVVGARLAARFRKADAVRRSWRRYPGLVRLVEARGDEERLVTLVFPQDLDDSARRAAVGCVFFEFIGRSPGERETAGAAVGREDVRPVTCRPRSLRSRSCRGPRSGRRREGSCRCLSGGRSPRCPR